MTEGSQGQWFIVMIYIMNLITSSANLLECLISKLLTEIFIVTILTTTTVFMLSEGV